MKAMLAMFGGEEASMAEKFEILRRLLRLIDRAEKDKLVKVPPRAELRSLQKTLGSIVGGVPEVQRVQAAKFLEALGGEDGFVNHRDLVPVVDSLLRSDAFLDLVVRDAVPILFPGAENEKARRFLLALYPDAKDPGGGEGGGSGPKSQYAEEMRALYFDTARKDKAFRSYLFKQVGRVAIGTMREMGVELPRPGEPLPKHDGPASREFDIESLGGYLKAGAELGGKIQLVPSEDPVHDLPEGAARKLMDVVRRVQWPDGLPVRALSESMRGEVPSVRIYRDPKNGDGLLVSQQK